MLRQYLHVLRDFPDFANLFAAQLISLLGDWFSTVVLLTAVQRFYPGSEGWAVSLLLLARSLPPLILGPAAGVLVDRSNRQHLLIASNLFRAVVVLGFIPAISQADWIWLVYVLTVIQFILASVFEPGQSALIKNLVAPDHLVIANTLFGVSWSVMLALGAAIGGGVATLFGSETALLVDSATFLLAAWLIWRIKGYRYAPRTFSAHDGDSTSFWDGVRYLHAHPTLAWTLMVKFGNSLGNVDTLMSIYATQIFVLGTDGQVSLGILYSAFGVGAVLGPLILNRFNNETIPRLRQFILIGFTLTTLSWVMMGAAASLWVLCLALMIRAMGGSANWTYSTVIIQKSADDRYLGRVFSLDMTAFYVSSVLSTVMHGAAIDAVGSVKVGTVAFATTFVALVPLAVWAVVMPRLNAQPQPMSSALPTSAND